MTETRLKGIYARKNMFAGFALRTVGIWNLGLGACSFLVPDILRVDLAFY
jgi:hypothetical protein